MVQPIDISGKRFGLLTAMQYTLQTLSSGRKMSAWVCRCDCGQQMTVMTVNLTKGKPYSCGCARKPSEDLLGITKMPEYRIHRQMMHRCYLKTARNYPWYGAKGVTVCDRWRFGEDGRTGFLCFYGDMGPRPEGLTLDRKDPRLGYGPGNCIWASWKEQANNKREHYLGDVERSELSRSRSAALRVKCTDSAIIDIRKKLASGMSQTAIAAEVGISQGMISKIKLGEIAPLYGSDDSRTLCLYRGAKAY